MEAGVKCFGDVTFAVKHIFKFCLKQNVNFIHVAPSGKLLKENQY